MKRKDEPGHSSVTVYGAPWCSDCKRAKKFLGEQRIHYHWVDVETDAKGLALVERVNDGKRTIPTVVFEDDSILVEPSNAELATKLGLEAHAKLSYYGLSPNTEWLPKTVERDCSGFIKTSPTLQTSVPGVFAAGDARLGSTKQAASAAGEGATAALMVREYLKSV